MEGINTRISWILPTCLSCQNDAELGGSSLAYDYFCLFFEILGLSIGLKKSSLFI